MTISPQLRESPETPNFHWARGKGGKQQDETERLHVTSLAKRRRVRQGPRRGSPAAARRAIMKIVPTVSRGLVDPRQDQDWLSTRRRALSEDCYSNHVQLRRRLAGEYLAFLSNRHFGRGNSPIDCAALRSAYHNVLHEIKAQELGLQTYFNFRSKSEQQCFPSPFG